ncbi:GntR family transcriptional regulator [Actinocorallia herbida]|uniref:GntR family transcriptional regulator n=1 Tax=Actinocorallia herbida TaxID=58109 RepID=A0A3N1D0F0_9ACTN|nr:GntR family transcriptional regulator [Actinocorallia herbida]ROO86990.1 GntR family transcriptional regulator [Actinocorallia herbida]
MTRADGAGPPGVADMSLPEQIYQRLREQIISGELRPGQRLIERELSEALQVSRVPLRTALPQLETDGFIDLLPRRGAVVTQLTLRDVAEVFDVWEALEVLATRLAAQRMAANPADEGLRALAESIDTAREAARAGDRAAAERATSAFHGLVLDLAGHRLLERVMRSLSGRREWLTRMTGKQTEEEFEEHDRLFRAIAQGQVEVAGALALAHVARIREQAMTELAGVLPPDAD